MKKIKQTKALENALARGILATHQTGEGNPVDRALLLLLEEGNCHASHILGKLLKGWELFQIKSKIETESAAGEQSGTTNIDVDFHTRLTASLREICTEIDSEDEDILNTAHLLVYIMRNKQFASSRVLAMYNITPDQVKKEAEDLPANEDYYEEMNALRNIRILHINPPQLKGRDSESGDDESGRSDEHTPQEQSKTPKRGSNSLEKYGKDLTKAARNGEIDPVIGREKEIERLIQILGRRKKNNPILIGEAGVGKSAIAEGLALRLSSREVPPTLMGKTLFSLDITSLVAGTKYRGEFEERIKAFMKELSKNKDTILFIDEIHTIVGAGSTQGSLDTANILKPALARGELQCIGATTLDEFRENIENDAALERRFQKIIVEPPTKDETLAILSNIKGHYEQHHNVRYSDQALDACVELTDRYITDRHFPDKAIDVLDEAGSRTRLLSAKEPEVLRDLDNMLNQVRQEKRRASAALDYEKASKARMQEVAITNRIKELQSDWLRELNLNPAVITAEHIQEVVSSMTGIPVKNVSKDEKSRLRDMDSYLSKFVIGQDAAISKITKSVQRSRAGLKDPDKPIGVFMFVGPTGVGKTLLAKELSKWMFDRKDALVRIDMSEYSEKHNVSRLIGSPPGYVGYNEGGQLTETVRRQPYAVLLFDEIEKAHPDVFNIMLQIFDEGQLTDGSGRKVDFRNTVIIMTSNVGSRKVARKAPVIGYDSPDLAVIEAENTDCNYRDALESTFAPEFINRIDDVVIFNTLPREDVKKIVELEIGHLFRRVEAMGYGITVSDGAKEYLADLGYEPRYGVRSLKRVILEYVEEPLAHLMVCEELLPGDSIEIDFADNKLTICKAEQKCPTSA